MQDWEEVKGHVEYVSSGRDLWMSETQGQRPRDQRCLVHWRNYREARERGPDHTELLLVCACLLSTHLLSMYFMYYFMMFLQKPREVDIKFLLHRWKQWCPAQDYSALFWQQWNRNPNSKPFPQHGNDLDKHLLPHLKFPYKCLVPYNCLDK